MRRFQLQEARRVAVAVALCKRTGTCGVIGDEKKRFSYIEPGVPFDETRSVGRGEDCTCIQWQALKTRQHDTDRLPIIKLPIPRMSKMRSRKYNKFLMKEAST